MKEDASRHGDEDRVAELLRINAELASEIRSLSAGRTANPRSAPMPAARRVGRILDDRDSLASQLEDTRRELEDTRRELEAANAHREALEHEKDEVTRYNEELGRQNHELAAEVARLRSGVSGLARRLRARILRS